MYQAGGTIKSLIDKVASKEYILPAIQREFVWKPDQICQLFDSLLQGYPFGTFLFWKIKPENRNIYQFYDFVKDYHQRDNPHCERLSELPEQEFVAVLDGQQRMTALNIGLRGSYSWKMAGKWWSSDDAFPYRRLYLNLLGAPDDDSGSVYQFEFLTKELAEQVTASHIWLRVGRILEDDIDDLTDELDERELSKDDRKRARVVLRLLRRTIYDQDKISFYEEQNQDLERVLNIFIRMNSGGTPLSYSDLLLSIAVAQWDKLDAREEIHTLVDEMNREGDGFSYSKDLVLKAGLMLSDIGSVGFKVENFNKTNMAVLEDTWGRVRQSLLLAVRLLSAFGFNGQNLRADSALLPIAYYLHFRGLDDSYLSRSEFAKDRALLRHWLVKSLLKSSGIWGSGLDTLLTAIRRVIVDRGRAGFPEQEVEAIMAGRGKSLVFTEEELDELSSIDYGNKRTFALLSIIFPGFDFSHHFHVDHIYPQGLFNKSALRKSDLHDEQIELLIKQSNQLPNLQLLEGSINNEKRQKMPDLWYEQQWPDPIARGNHLQSQAIDFLVDDLNLFVDFYEARKKTLRSRIGHLLNG
ncbi:DUF262 domain-containing protein [Reinekea forsetii]|uniref:GmrSD restriction endonucleases N-terminal domain-containing protein n=1 Tax=Reinekea forsetii TaxID=1336806 RepID=A0A2K8KQT1_9GAMM|nr:DUF262 domain-containing protein [Reinekea forsetii]ATX77100.1 hypothetical protein REIFOR_01963 [Reinekea forsetii]